MAQYLSNELAGTTTGTSTSPTSLSYRPAASSYRARLRRIRATITLATQTTSDTLLFGTLPAGATFCFGVITTDTSLSTATLAIGISGSTGKYRAAATFTATNTPTLFGVVAAMDDAALSAEENVIGTIATASLPGSGILIVDLYYSAP